MRSFRKRIIRVGSRYSGSLLICRPLAGCSLHSRIRSRRQRQPNTAHFIPVYTASDNRVLLQNMNVIGKPCALHPKEPHRAVKSRIRKARAPIPTKHAVCLAQLRIARHCIRTLHVADFLMRCRDKFRRRIKRHLQFILPWLQNTLYVVFEAPVHVLRMPQEFSVQHDIRYGINAVKPQDYTVVFQYILLRDKGFRENEVILHELQRIQLVVPPVRVRHQLVLQ